MVVATEGFEPPMYLARARLPIPPCSPQKFIKMLRAVLEYFWRLRG